MAGEGGFPSGARRFLDRVVLENNADWANMSDVDFQDMMWAFFQNCWHLKDWIKHDPSVPKGKKGAAIDLAHKSSDLMICRQLCDVTKRLGARSGKT
jgi:hypothetical protein